VTTAPNERPLFTWFRTRSPWQIFWIAFALRVAVIFIARSYRVPADNTHFKFAFEAGRIARALVTGYGYADPFNGHSGPTAWLPPLYPLLIALSFKLFGIYTRGAAIFLLIANSLFSALVVPATYEIAARCFDARGIARRATKSAAPIALWAAWVWAVYPAFLQYAIRWLWEMSLTTCLFTWALLLTLRLRGIGGTRSTSLATWVALGALWGGIALSNASLLLVFPASLLYIAWPNLKRTIPGAFTACIVFALVLAPWVIRNERTMHAFILTRDNFGVELYSSSLEANDGLPWGTSLPLSPDAPEFRQYVQMGEVHFSAMRSKQAMARLRARPRLFLHWTLDRIFFFWDGTPHPPDRHPIQEFFRQLSYSFLSYSGLLGLLLMLRRRVPGAVFFALPFLLLPLPYYLVTAQPRFRAPLEPLIAILMVYLFRSAQTSRAQSNTEGLA
jgi:hypothetical protein